MDIAEATSFVQANHRAVMATFKADGRPQLSPVVAAVDDGGRIVVSTRETAVKTRNLQRDNRVSVCVLSDTFFGEWVQLDGTAEVVHMPDALPLLEDYYRRVSGEHPDWDDYRRAMAAERRVAVRVSVTSAGPTISG
jgi:PPOX class probable F420-dependent enzyme